MSIMYGNRYVAKIYDYKSGAIITDNHNNKEILINELDYIVTGKQIGRAHV